MFVINNPIIEERIVIGTPKIRKITEPNGIVIEEKIIVEKEPINKILVISNIISLCVIFLLAAILVFA